MLRVHEAGRLLYVKRQRNHLCRTWRHPLGWPTVSREWFYLHLLKQLGVPAPQPVFHASRKTNEGFEAVLVTEELKGYQDLDQYTDLDAASLSLLADALGQVLGRLHRAKLQHSCLYGKHVMLRWDDGKPSIALIDLEKLRPRLTRNMAAAHDLEQLKRRQQVLVGDDWQRMLNSHARAMNGAGD